MSYSWEDNSGIDWGQTPGIDYGGDYSLPGLSGTGALSSSGGGAGGFLKGLKFLTDFAESKFGSGGKYQNQASYNAEKRKNRLSSGAQQVFDNFAVVYPPEYRSPSAWYGGTPAQKSTADRIGGAALSAGKGALAGAPFGPIPAIGGAVIGAISGAIG